jgi:GxxExxY protein
MVDGRRHPPLPTELSRLRFRVLGVAYRLHSEVGPSLKEDSYRRWMIHSLRQEGLRVDVERRVDLTFDGLRLAGVLRPDLIIEDKILVELKAQDVPLSIWNAQVLSYLWHTHLPLGYLINFHAIHLRDGIRPFFDLPTRAAAPIPSTPSPPSP